MEKVATPGFQHEGSGRNKLLETLESATRRRISPYLQSVSLELGTVVCQAGAVLDCAYFPVGSVLSLLTVLQSGSAIETANIGSEGAFGLFAVLTSCVSFVRCVIGLQGNMIRCPIDVLREEVSHSQGIRDICGLQSESILDQVQQNMVCNAQHDTEERLCRWLLTMQDRAGGEALAYPQSFVAGILGENGQSITLAAQSMQADGLVNYRRGAIQIADRQGLERASCECYAILSKRFAIDLL